MAKLLCIGIATLDIINEVAHYPSEDDEVRIIRQIKRRGGNASNTAVVLSQLGHQSYWAGTLVDEVDAQLVLEDFKNYHINYHYCQHVAEGKIPTSYITLNRENGSRTICHFRDSPEFSFNAFKRIPLEQFTWLHFEGRNCEQTLLMLAHVKEHHPAITVSLEIEKPREGIEELIPLADIVMFSKTYAQSRGFHCAQKFCLFMDQQYLHKQPNKQFFCAWGKAGAAAIEHNHYYWQNAPSIDAIDTIAAGDVFNAAVIDQRIQRQTLKQSLAFACQIAARQCQCEGLKL
jgi:ketohexokinase